MKFNFFGSSPIKKDDLPTNREMDVSMRDTLWSPDLYMLEQYKWQLLFVPDEVQRGFPSYDMIAESVFRGHAWTRHPFEFWLKELGDDSYPIPMETKNRVEAVSRYFPPPAKIKGEVHMIRPYQFAELDKYKLNGVKFFRRRIPLLFPYTQLLLKDNVDERNVPLPLALRGKKGTKSPEIIYIMRAWMYIGVPEFWRPLLKLGSNYSIVKHYESKSRSWARPYYQFRRRITL